MIKPGMDSGIRGVVVAGTTGLSTYECHLPTQIVVEDQRISLKHPPPLGVDALVGSLVKEGYETKLLRTCCQPPSSGDWI